MNKQKTTMEFKDFDLLVESYNSLGNKRYLIFFHTGQYEFYKQVGNKFIKEKREGWKI